MARHMTSSLRFLSVMLVLLSGVCVPGCGGDKHGADGPPCGTYTDAGVRICCGASTEIPGFSCVDLTQDGGEYGIYGRCIGKGETFEAKIAGAQCCEGLVRAELDVETDEVFEDYPPGCGPGSAPPSVKICLECGNQVCEEGENACNCAEDCPRGAADAGA
jgi:hypothetical protein